MTFKQLEQQLAAFRTQARADGLSAREVDKIPVTCAKESIHRGIFDSLSLGKVYLQDLNACDGFEDTPAGKKCMTKSQGKPEWTLLLLHTRDMDVDRIQDWTLEDLGL